MTRLATALLLLVSSPLVLAQSFRTEAINNGNGFTANEIFATSTTAATGYDAYAVWDAEKLYFGITGQDVGNPACDPAESSDCPIYESGQSINKYIAYYLDTDPQDDVTGTTTAYIESGWTQSWTLPFKADYLVLIRTAGETTQEGFYTGNTFLYEWTGSAWEQTAAASGPAGSSVLVIGDNNSSNYLEFSLERSAVGSPEFLRVASWFFNTEDLSSTPEDDRISYAYWPSSAPADGETSADGTTSGATTLDAYYGFVLVGGQYPNASNGQANLNRPFVPGLVATPVNNGVPAQGAFPGTTVPFHSLGYTNSNDFSGNEVFTTSTPDADTGYDVYFTWDDTNLHFGVTGSDIGGGDCSDLTVASCDVFELGQSPNKWIVLYLDTDPAGTGGTDQAAAFGSQSWTLPFMADYYVAVRTDGVTVEGDYTGVADLKRWDGSQWVSEGPVDNLEIFDNSSSGFLKFVLDLGALGSPDFLKATAWIVNDEDFASTSADDRISYAYWPSSAPADGETSADGTTSGATTLDAYYGFELKSEQIPNGSNGLANLNRPFFGTFTCAPPADPGDSPGTSFPFHTIPINGSNSFNSSNEEFETSTSAATGYAAYATWDRVKLYFGATGSDVGGGDCADPSSPDCATFETGQSPQKWLVYFIDTDPTTSNGTTTAYVPTDTIETSQSWTLPFPADYAIYLRTDGTSRDASPYTGVAEVKRYAGGAWESLGPCPLEVWDNNTSGYLEFSVDLTDLGSPSQIKVASWFLDAANDRSYAYWPEDAPATLAADGTTTGDATLETYWGFELEDGQIPNSLGNKNKEFFDSVPDQTTYNTYQVDGTTAANEQLPQEYLGRESTSTSALYLTWDADNLYLSFTENPLVDSNSDLYLAFSTDPTLSDDPRDGTGSFDQPDVGAAADAYGDPDYPFAADVVVRFDGAATADASVQSPAPGNQYTYGSGSWSEEAMPSGVEIIRQAAGPTEVAVPWSAIGLAEGDYFHLVAYLNDSGNGVDQQWPPENPNAQNSDMTHFYSYYLQEGAEPFSSAYKSVRTDQGSTLSQRLYANVYLVVPNADQNSATWGLSANTTVVNELFIGQGATLNVGSNAGNPSGFNELRFGRRMTVVGEFLEKESTVFTFDPQVGFPEDDQPGGGFATPSFTSKVVCDASFYDLVLLNETEFLDCPADASATEAAALVALGAPAASADHADHADLPAANCDGRGLTIGNSITLFGPTDLDLTLGPDATITNLSDDTYITGSLTRIAQEASTTLFFEVGDDADYRPVTIDLEQSSDAPTRYTAAVIGEPAPLDDALAGPIKRISDVRYYQAAKCSDGAELEAAAVTFIYGADDGVTFVPTLRLAELVRSLKDGEAHSGGLRWAQRRVDASGTSAEGGGPITPLRPLRTLDPGLFALAGIQNGRKANPLGTGFNGPGQGSDLVASSAGASASLPETYALHENYPNPFNPQTTIRFELPERAEVVLSVFDVTGREVARLVDGERVAGRYEVAFDAGHLASGLYFYSLRAGSYEAVRRMVLVK